MPEFRPHFDSDGTIQSVTAPRYAFKFATINDYTLASLSQSYLWFSLASEFNDVFELPTKVRTDLTDADLKKYLRANLAHHWPKFGLTLPGPAALEAQIDQLISDRDLLPKMFRVLQDAQRDLVRIHCLSMRYDDPLMWAHYAASFAGVCLVYDFPLLGSAGPWFALQVKYLEEPPPYDPIEQSIRQLTAPTPYENVAAHVEHDQLQFGTKLMAWSHEQELRLCTLSGQPKLPYPRNALVGVILGPRIAANAEELVIKAASTGREELVVGRLIVDHERNTLSVPGLENYNVELRVSGVRNLSRKARSNRPGDNT